MVDKSSRAIESHRGRGGTSYGSMGEVCSKVGGTVFEHTLV